MRRSRGRRDPPRAPRVTSYGTLTLGGMVDRLPIEAEPRLVLLAFVHEGCEPCRQVLPQLRALAGEAREICRVEVVDAAREGELVERYGVREFPTLLFLKAGVEVHRLRGGALPASTLALLRATTT
jgi:thiol-disulfide isomerase/thioredoxin